MKKTLRFLKKITPMLALAVMMMAPNFGWGQTPTNPGFEDGTNSWTTAGSASTTNSRTGTYSLMHTTSSTSNVAHTNSSTISVPPNYYGHVIGWAIGSDVNSQASCGGTLGSTTSSTTISTVGTTLTQLTYKTSKNGGSAQDFSCRVNTRSTAGTTTLYWDDIVMYTSSLATTDVTAPTAASSITTGTVTSSSASFSWTNGSDAETGIQNTIILRTTNTSASAPVLNNQGQYSTSGGINGPNSIGDWSILSISESSSSTSFTDNSVAASTSYLYAVLHRDLAYNFSTATSSSIITTIDGSTPTITTPVPTTLSDFSAVAGTASSAQTFTISGINLTADLVVTAPTDYEMRENNVGDYGASVSFTPSSGTVSEKTLQVRIASSASVGTPSGNVACTSTDATTQNVEVSGTVYDQIDWCNVQFPASGTINLGGDFTVYAQVNKSGVTDASGQGAGITAWIGYGTTSSDLSGYTWILASYNKDEGNNDEYMANIGTAISPEGTYYYASRFQLGSSPFYVYGGYNAGGGGFWNGTTYISGVLTVEPISIPDVIITEVYGGGGNSGATWKNDFIELLNTTSSPINISGWSIQYYSATAIGTTTNTFVIPEDKSIPAKSNFLIQAAAGSGGTLDLLLPDAICVINLSATEGKIILYTTDEAQTITSALASITGNTYFKDYVPYGKTTVPVWGSAMPSNTSSTTSATRKTVEGSYVYTQNIGNDFEVIAPTPQNTGIAYFRSKANGNWGDISTWESSSDNNTWIAAVSLPLMKDNVVIDHAVILAADGTADSYNLTINGGGSLNIASDASKSGSLIARGVVSGNTTVQRYLTGGWAGWNTGWHQISSPVAAQAISTFETTGVGNGYDFYGWKEADNLWMNYKDGGFSGWNGGTNFNVGQGYMVSYEAANVTQAYTGVLNAADVTKTNLSYNVATGNGWHLLGNPFASALKWNDGNWTLSNVAGGAKIWNETNKSYSDIAANGFIPSAQGFMVQVSGGTNSMTIPAASRVHNATPFYKSIASSERFLLVAAETESSSAQESKIIINPMATEGFDFDYDSRFLAGNAPQFYAVVADEKVSTNSLPSLHVESVIPYGFVKNQATQFTISLAETIEGQAIFLTDKKTNTIQKLSENPVYSFTSAEGDNPDRFLLHFGVVGIGEQPNDIALQAYVYGNQLFVINEKGKANLQIFDLQGRLLQSRQLLSEGLHSEALTLTAGVYVVRLQSAQATQSVKVIVQ